MAAPEAGLRNEDLPALFWDELPNDPEHPDAMAIKAIIDESTPEDRAESFKEQGNRALKTGLQQKKKFYLRQAIEQYTLGLELQCSNATLVAQLYGNRAHVSLLLGNYRNALEDARAALKADPTFVKAYWRGAKAAAGLRRWEECRYLCEEGLGLDADNADLARLRQRCSDEERTDAQRAEEEKRRAAEKRAPARHLATAMLEKGWRVGRPQFSVGNRKPSIDADGAIHWPVIFFYPEASMQQDVIEDFSVTDTFRDHLDCMFGPDGPPLDWDVAGDYGRSKLEVYYLSHASKAMPLEALTEALYGGWPEVRDEGPSRYGPNAATWQRVEEGWTLEQALARADHVVPGIPVFFILSSSTPYKARFLSGDIPLL
ncbi:CNS1 [Auxenochlorella protothecoides x Auxenochlorella symbiontica]